MFAGFIFDVEGTLVDSVPQNLRSRQEALERAGIDVPYAALQLYSGLDGNQTLQILAPDLGDDTTSKPSAGSVKCLKLSRCAAAGSHLPPIAKVPSSSITCPCYTDEFIGATACGDDVEHGKPDPRIVGVALRKLGITGREAVMIGDTPYDAEAASGAGTAAAGVLSGGFTQEALRGAGFAVAGEISRLLTALEDTKPFRARAV
jgi:phosphoglycolate phosphatase-like HAD superfamily hydrolase